VQEWPTQMVAGDTMKACCAMDEKPGLTQPSLAKSWEVSEDGDLYNSRCKTIVKCTTARIFDSSDVGVLAVDVFPARNPFRGLPRLARCIVDTPSKAGPTPTPFVFNLKTALRVPFLGIFEAGTMR